MRKLLVLFTAGLVACSFKTSLESTLDDYRRRLQRVLDIEVITPARQPDFQFPTISAPTNNVETTSINLIDFNRLSQCELSSLIAQRNTTLGKVQPISQRFVYEAKLLTLLERCQLSLALSDAELSAKIGHIYTIKQTQFSVLWAQLLQKSDEIRTSLSVSHGTLSNTTEHTEMNSVVALSYLTSLKDKPMEVVNKEVESSLATLQLSRLPAKLWRTQYVLARQLANITDVASPKLEQMNCRKTTDFNKAEILKNIFQLFFIQQIQPIGSALNHYHYQLQPIWERWQSDDKLSPQFKRYVRKHAELGFSEYQTQMQRHVTMWQNFFKQCGIEVSATNQNQ